jgi:hypothetical protein
MPNIVPTIVITLTATASTIASKITMYRALSCSSAITRFNEVASLWERSHEHLFNGNLKQCAIFSNDGNKSVLHSDGRFLGGDVGHTQANTKLEHRLL